MRKRKRSKLPLLFIAAGAVFVVAVFWQVLPRGGFETGSSAQLEARLSEARETRERELQTELERRRRENQNLRSEIERLKEGAVE